MINLGVITYSDILKIEKKFKNGGNQKNSVGHSIIPGSKDSKVMISCPHSVSQIRNGKLKKRELFLGVIALYLQELTGCHLIIKTANLEDDANIDRDSRYKKDLYKYIKENNISLLLDLHGSESRLIDIEIGTYFGNNINNSKDIIKRLYTTLIDFDITSIRCDRINYAGKGTIAYDVNKNTGIKAIQIEIGKRFRWPKTRMDSFKLIIKGLEKYINAYNSKLDKIYSGRNYVLDYDKVLDIKPSYGFKRELGKIDKSSIGMELELGINYQREMYSFIKKMLKKLKDVVGDNGYFVHDNTVISDYSFEIVLDPLPVDKLIDIYSKVKDILAHSSNQIYSNKKHNCGIHLNFNKKDVIDLNDAHRRMLNFMFNEKQYFNYNLYKKSKFITTYEEYLKYQREVGSRYIAINYSSKKIIEVRNISANLKPNELREVCEKLLYIMYNIEPSCKKNVEYIDFVETYERALKKIELNKAKTIFEENVLIIDNITKNPELISKSEFLERNKNNE